MVSMFYSYIHTRRILLPLIRFEAIVRIRMKRYATKQNMSPVILIRVEAIAM